jgi:magnesium-transporting ATPase (P-type)
MSEVTEASPEKAKISYHSQSVTRTLEALNTDKNRGLSTTEAANRLNLCGHNELAKKEGESIWEKIKEQFEDLLVRILLGAAIVSFIVSQFGKQTFPDFLFQFFFS